MDKEWSERVKNSFDNAALTYKGDAIIQRKIAGKLANLCLQRPIPKGTWADLGSGTGLLADSLEQLKPNQSIIRIDSSPEMLKQQSKRKISYIWDLNEGLPYWSKRPTLLASSFALHWLSDPLLSLREWFNALAPGGWIALALPIAGSFKEWHEAALQSKIPCSAISFPSGDVLLQEYGRNIRYQELHKLTQRATRVSSLLKPMIKVGAQTSTARALKVPEWRQIQKHWPKDKSHSPKDISLTWLIQLILIQK